jgi:hypothetical protein
MEYAKYAYVWTLNNPTPEEVLSLRGCVGRRGISYICWGREVAPTTGTPHLQGYVQGTQKQFSRLKEAMGSRIANFAPAMAPSGPNANELAGVFGEPYTAIGYTMKEGDWVEFGTKKDHPGSRGAGSRSDLDSVKEAIERGESYDDICTTHFGTAAKFGKFIKERVQARDTGKRLDSLREQFGSAVLKPWQRELRAELEEEPNPRTIKWIWSEEGGTGKSYIATYLGAMDGATILTAGKKVDLAYIFSKNPTKVVIFDLSRTTAPEEGKSHFLDGIYSLAEDLKNGRLVTTKYESATIFFPPPHVVVFANYPPDMSKWSHDRYDVRELV